MRKHIVSSLAVLLLITVFGALAQTGTPRYSWDDSYHYHSFHRDSISATDSNFVQYSPAHQEKFRGFYALVKSTTGTPTLRFCTVGSEATSLDSTVFVAGATIQRFVSQRTYPSNTLTAGTNYRIQFIQDATKLPVIGVDVILITSDR